MNKQRLITLCLAFTVLCLAPVVVYAQQEPEDPQHGRGDTPQNKPSLLIINGSDSSAVSFSVKNGGGHWVTFSLDPRKDGIFHNTTNIQIVSANAKTVEYRLAYANRYRIYWNRDKECWDVTRLVPRK